MPRSKTENAGLMVVRNGSACYHGWQRPGPACPCVQENSLSLINVGSAWCATGTAPQSRCCFDSSQAIKLRSPDLSLKPVPPLEHSSFSRPPSGAENFASIRLMLLSICCDSAISYVAKQPSTVKQHLPEHKLLRPRLQTPAGFVLASEHQGQANTKYQQQELSTI